MKGLRLGGYSNRVNFLRHFGTKPKRDHYDAIVVGGGHNGLVAAAYLSKSGLKYVNYDSDDFDDIDEFNDIDDFFQDLCDRKTSYNWWSSSYRRNCTRIQIL